MSIVTVYTGADKAADFKTCCVNEIRRRLGIIRDESHRDRSNTQRNQRCCRVAELEALADFIEAIVIEPENAK